MKKKKRSNFFKFIKKNDDIINDINHHHPLKLNKIEYIIDKIHEKYPVASKTEIALVVKTTFEAIREFLVLGYVLNFNGLFFDTKLLFFPVKNRNNPSVKIQSKTPPPLKKT